MTGKEGKGKGGGGPKRDVDIKEEQVTQAVLLADSFATKFRPITLEKPKALLPLVNVPMIDYTLELLTSSGIQEIFVFCSSLAKDIESYIKGSKWVNVPNCSIKTVVSQRCGSVGDALRDIDGKHMIRSDFILISGDVVSNMRISAALAEHKARREKDKQAIMTLVLRKINPQHPARLSSDDDCVIGINPSTNQLLHYQNVHSERHASMSVECLQEHPQIQLRYDLLDADIYICAPEFLFHFTDNFDYEDIKKDFLRGILQSEILGNKVYVHVLSTEFAARVRDLRTYDHISQNIISRWVYPVVPDYNINGATSYKFSRPAIYKEDGVFLARSCQLLERTVVGSGTSIGERTQVSKSVIGRNCVIGADVKIEGAYIWDNVVIEDGVRVTRSVVCNNSKLSRGCAVEKGCVISYRVVIGPNHRLPPRTMLTTSRLKDVAGDDEDDEDMFSEDSEPTSEPQAGARSRSTSIGSPAMESTMEVGVGGYGVRWTYADEEDEEEEDKVEPVNNLTLDERAPEQADEETDEEGEEEGADAVELDPQERFEREVQSTVLRAVEELLAVETTVLEVNGLKFAYNMTAAECAKAILNTLLRHVEPQGQKGSEVLSAFKKLMAKWHPLISRFARKTAEQHEVVDSILETCSESRVLGAIFQYILQVLYDLDVLSEDSIFRWANVCENAAPDSVQRMYLQQSQKFLEWLRNAEEEEDED